ncbi:MAG: Asp23/Gls24 family envelope stress response protein [Anaerolineae bacterium]
MVENSAIPGMVTVEPTVLETIARLTTLEVPGVVGVVERDMDRLLGVPGKSVAVQVRDKRVVVDLHILAGPDRSLLQLGRKVQYEVTRAIQQMIGMPVEAVNVHIEDVVYSESSEWAEAESE